MLGWFLENTLVAAILAASVWLVCRVRRLSPPAQHALWLVVLLKLVTPPLVSWPWSLPSFASASRTGEVRLEASELGSTTIDVADPATRYERSASARGLHEQHTDAFDRCGDPGDMLLATLFEHVSQGEGSDDGSASRTVWQLSSVNVDLQTEGQPGQEAKAVTSRIARGWFAVTGPQVLSIATRLWLLGTAISLVVHVVQIVRFVRVLARADAAPSSLVARVKRIAATLRVRPPRVVRVSHIRSPVIWGGLRTRLVWPACLEADRNTDRWDGVIAHEMAHLRRRDHWVGWLELLAGCIWWWNPLFWYVRYQLRENAELACDAIVVWALPDGRRTYAESLIEVVSHFSKPVAPWPVLGVHSLARQAFERRLTMILSERVPCRLSVPALLVIGLLTLVALPGWSPAQVASTPQAQEPAADTGPAPIILDAAAAPIVELSVTPPDLPDAPDVSVEAAPAVAAVVEQAAGDDSRIDALERKLEAIIAEVRALRQARRGTAAPPSVVAEPTSPAATPRSRSAVTAAPSIRARAARIAAASGPTGLGGDVQMLSRATYKLPKAKAEALAAFLREHMKSPVEAKVEDDSLIVTAPPDAQGIVGQFIALSEGTARPRGATIMYQSSQNKLVPSSEPATGAAVYELFAPTPNVEQPPQPEQAVQLELPNHP